ncbi:hypothetical protein [Actinoplanes awajinensis]|uniref:Transmembrane protein n=1 Tax=Actinoplanes awajinensis subsp. mycoplanecinus TaxID=135947 RepID=A0A101JJ95_9ACTN|nr:hypothetical protein [Actinoplanes awajinensis]KUL27854.1 hypothetical protein ADL15_34020 [Actinoplanes awajinensis subsp. mycoplanecinus]
MENNAAEQLAAIADTRTAVAGRLVTPWWYHPALGLALAGYVLGLGLGGTPVSAVFAMLFILVCLGLAHLYKRRTGVWVSGFEAGRASRWAYAMGALVGVIVAATWATTAYTNLNWPVWALAATGFAGTVLLGRQFDAALRAQLRAAA